MSFPRYPAYKDSGVEWLGEVPGHWGTLPLSRTATADRSLFIDGDWIESKDLSDEGIRYLTSGNVGDGYYKEQGQGYISEETFTALNCVEVIPGDVLISRLNLPIGRACLVPDLGGRIVTCVDNVIVRPDPDFDRRFFIYQLTSKSHFANMENLARGTTMQRISRSVLGRVRFAVPPLPEQTQIAAFLDRETSKIDALVAEQRRLMALLKEKRQAVISHAVTRGLNPNAPMKPSGIEWLGDVPAHWKSPKLKTLALDRPAAFTNGPFGSDLLTSELQEEGVPVIYIRDLKVDGYRRRSTSYVTAEKAIQLDKFRVDEYDVLMAKVGDPPGFCCTYPEGEQPGIICQDVIRMKPNLEQVSPDYLCFLLNSPPGVEAIDSICIQLTRKRFSLADLHSLRLPLPPRSEQDDILHWLEKAVGEFHTLTTEAQRAIDLLQERRTALISAAVTGQIDVRSATQ